MLISLFIIANLIIGILFINTLIAMACTKKIDKYWVRHPEWESSFLYFQFNRFTKYGYYVLTKKPFFIEPPRTVKLWVSISFIFNVVTIVPLVLVGVYVKYFN